MDKAVFTNFPIIHTERLTLRALANTDTYDFYRILSSETAMRYYGIMPIETREIASWFIDQYRSGFLNETLIRWAITLRESDDFIGSCGFQGLNENASRAEIGYELHPNYWGVGYMKEALSAIIAWGFDIFELNRIEALIYPENRPSEKTVLSLGFTLEGCLKEYAFFRNQYTDLNLFRLLKREYTLL
ncbi:MAG: [ribosomal protein S5]-alanine N-acetyltransferase [Clostridiales bacterium]|jgi:ribosomal-protein-alanine N-acetyltransferase|nr:[ribosomal protein S5]-alanine N-acetyltransferase [Clostridiales bacterium]MDN5299009.1 [ribosomal protein S5]-alanine N-acetyltransferase [Clostridiales bacterium]